MRATKLLFVTAFTLAIITLTASAQPRRGALDALRFRFVGPAVGNRVAAIAGVPGDPTTYYAGAASGGVWKSSDGGENWFPVFDGQPVAAIGSLAVAASDPNIVWAGTGEAWAIRDSDLTGNGVYKSTDAGRTWTHMGLDNTGRIGRVIVHPSNPEIVYVCALGRLTGPQQERGVFKTSDGGAHWDRVLFADENTGCSGLSLDARNTQNLVAGMWQAEMHTWGMNSGGPGSGVYVSHDGGTKWTRVTRGLPQAPVGKIDVAIAPSNPDRVYALIQTKDQGSVWRSEDGGTSWRAINWDRALIGRAGYYIRLGVSPANENEVLVANSSFFHSVDGGETFRQVPWGGDNHDIWIDPKNPDRFALTDDAGLRVTTLHGRSFHHVTLPIGQMYHVAVDNQVPYYVYTNMQDSSTMRGPSLARGGGGFGFGRPPADDNADDAPARPPGGGGGFGGGGNRDNTGWEMRMGGCESGFTLPDPTDPNIVWATCYGNEVTRWDGRTKTARSVSPWIHTLDSAPNESKYRCHWTPPMAIDPFDHNTVYYGCQVIFKTSNGGQNWAVISPDLSTQEPAHNQSSGGIVGDNLGQFYAEVVFAIAPSTLQKGLIWAGTNDGLVWFTKDGGGHWNNVTKNISGIPQWGSITSIQPSFFDASTAYVSVDAHLADNRDPFIYKTTDMGATWTLISGGLPNHGLGYVKVVAQDPNQKGLLFAGTGNALFYSLDDGGHWTTLSTGLPHASVTWAVVQKQFHDLVVSTYGRGVYILDDITPLERMAAEQQDVSVQFFPPRPAYRLIPGAHAFLNYSLKASAKDPVRLQILDSQNKVIREIHGSGREGLNRLVWDMHYEPPQLAALRTTPPENPHIWEEPRFRGKDSRPITHWGIGQAEVGPIVAPGKYTARLTVGGETYSQSLDVLNDPNVSASEADLEATTKMQLRIRDDINTVSGMVNQIEWIRKQFEDDEKMLKTQKGKNDVLASIQDMDKKLQDVEYKLFDKALRTSDDKYYVEAVKLYLDLIWFNAEVGTGGGDVAGGFNSKPTDTEVDILGSLEKELTGIQGEYRNLMEKEIPAFNRSLANSGVTPLTAMPASSGGGQNNN
ncbi:MAG TPA: hypothetical protein VKU01_18645 [Bryobacteraceae bacterium]|nr:hypothetical protein [Bryobacteraceae bacterium]